jgi:hypothetical protein
MAVLAELRMLFAANVLPPLGEKPGYNLAGIRFVLHQEPAVRT